MGSIMDGVDSLEHAGFLRLVLPELLLSCRRKMIQERDLLVDETNRVWTVDAENVMEQGVHVLVDEMRTALTLLELALPNHSTTLDDGVLVYRIDEHVRRVPMVNKAYERQACCGAALGCLQDYIAASGSEERFFWDLSGDYAFVLVATAEQWRLMREYLTPDQLHMRPVLSE